MTTEYRECPECEQSFAVRLDGKIRKHFCVDDRDLRLRKLGQALVHYGTHTDECSLHQAWNERNQVCDCGFEEALKLSYNGR